MAATKTYATEATGAALATACAHGERQKIRLYSACFCPFAQRVWISLEYKRMAYQYIEIDPYAKPKEMMDINPRGLVPALQNSDDIGLYESTVLMEYLEDLNEGNALLPSDAGGRARSRLWTDHVNRKIVPTFYKYLQAQNPDAQVELGKQFAGHVKQLVEAADPEGPFFLGQSMSFVDVQFAPWVIRLNRVLKPYRGWPDPEPGSRWGRWVAAIEADAHVRSTTSDDALYLDSYERYAENRPGTSQVADAINSGGVLP